MLKGPPCLNKDDFDFELASQGDIVSSAFSTYLRDYASWSIGESLDGGEAQTKQIKVIKSARGSLYWKNCCKSKSSVTIGVKPLKDHMKLLAPIIAVPSLASIKAIGILSRL